LPYANAPMVKRGTDRIDRFFFRSAYDARVILQDLAEKTRTLANRHEHVKLLETQIAGALHPKSFACYQDAGNGTLVAECGPVPGESDKIPVVLRHPKFPFRFGAVFLPRELDTIPANSPLLTDIAQRGKAWDVPQSPEALDAGPLAAECLVPILGRNSGLIGLLVIGPRLSDEPYSSEDRRRLKCSGRRLPFSMSVLTAGSGSAMRQMIGSQIVGTGANPAGQGHGFFCIPRRQ
jgi:hypothetical protein